MAQPVNAAGAEVKFKARTSSRVSHALKTGVVYGGSAVLTAVNNITPHIAGAVDILVIEQPDGSRKATPFYVRFGKYTAMRTRERNVKLYINDELAPFGMHIGLYGQAYFATEAVEIRGAADEDEQDALLAGMMSPPSGYSSGVDEPSPQQDARLAGTTLSAVQQHIDGGKEVRRGFGKSVAGTASGSSVPLRALGSDAIESGSPPSAVEAGMASALTEFTAAPAANGQCQQAHFPETGEQPELTQIQFDPSLSIADRNESFLSARETLPTPLSDELMATMLNSMSLECQQQPHTGSQQSMVGQGAGEAAGGNPSTNNAGGSRMSLEAVSEGASTYEWSEEEEENAGAAEMLRAEVEAGSPEATSSGKDEDAMSPLSTDPQQHLQHQHLQHQHNHHQRHQAGPQQPLHQQLGFPENGSFGLVATAAIEPTTVVDSALGALEPAKCATPFSPSSVSKGCDPGCSGSLDAHVPGPGQQRTVTGEGQSPRPCVELAEPMALTVVGTAATSFLPLPTVTMHSAALNTSKRDSYGFAQRSSPGAWANMLSSDAGADGHGPSCSSGPGSGPGSHSAVSLLSSSLRGSVGVGGCLSGATDGCFGTPGVGRPSLDWQRAKEKRPAEPQAPASTTGTAIGNGAVLLLADSASTDGPIGPIAAAAVAAAAGRPHEEHRVKLSFKVIRDCDVQVSLMVVSMPLPMQPEVVPGQHRGPMCSSGGAGEKESTEGLSPSASEGGYLGDAELGRAGGAPLVRQHHHGSHHHHYHFGYGHGHLRHNNENTIHSTSAPLPSSAMHAAAVPHAAATAAATEAASGVATSCPGAAVLGAVPAHGIELSLCSALLKQSMPYSEASALFDVHRVTEEAFFSRFDEFSGASRLAIRLSNGVIFPCQPLSYSLLGLLAFGTWRLPPGTPCWGSESADAAGGSEVAATSAAAAAAAAMLAAAVAQGAGVSAADAPKNGAAGAAGTIVSAAMTPKKGQAAGGTGTVSWRLWMFGGRREGPRTSATGGGGVSGRSPPLTSPVSERQSSVEHRPASTGMDTVITPLPAAGAALSPMSAQQCAAEGAPSAAVGANVDSSTSAHAPTGGSSGGGATPALRDSSQHTGYKVITKESLTPTSEQLAALPLKHGQNTIMYKVGPSELRAYVYFLPWRTRIVISDIDGTITKSDVLGHLLPAMGLDWSHPGIAELLTNIRQNNYLVMYLSSRSISQANITRDFINTLVQGEHRMPLGPVIISPHGLLPSLYREMILRRPHEFKIATLQDIRAVFPPDWNPFYGGFGNRDTDEISYREVGVQPSRIFIINPRGELRQPVDSSTREEPPANAAVAPMLVDASRAQNQEGAIPPSDGSEVPEQLTGAAPAMAAAAQPIPSSSAMGTREVSSRSIISVGRRASGSVGTATSVQLSTLSAINELVHAIFPPLLDGDALVLVEADSTADGDWNTYGSQQDQGDDEAASALVEDRHEVVDKRNGEVTGDDKVAVARDASEGRASGDEAWISDIAGGDNGKSVKRSSNSEEQIAAAASDVTAAPASQVSVSGVASAEYPINNDREIGRAAAAIIGDGLTFGEPGSMAVTTPRSAASPRSFDRSSENFGEQQNAACNGGLQPLQEPGAESPDVAQLDVKANGVEVPEESYSQVRARNSRGAEDTAATTALPPCVENSWSSVAAAGSSGEADGVAPHAAVAMGNGCFVHIPGSVPGTAVVDDIVATAVPLLA